MTDKELLCCLIAFILGWLISRHMGNGFSVGGRNCNKDPDALLGGFSLLSCEHYKDDCNKKYIHTDNIFGGNM